MDASTCPLCYDPYFLPFSWGRCHHTFCLPCLWRVLSEMEHQILCPMCRASDTEFAFNTEAANHMAAQHIRPALSRFNQGKLKLQFFLMKVLPVFHDISFVPSHLESDELDVTFDAALPLPPPNESALSPHAIHDLDTPDSMAEFRSDEEFQDDFGNMDQALHTMEALLAKIPMELLRGDKEHLRFVDPHMQRLLVEAVPNYQSW